MSDFTPTPPDAVLNALRWRYACKQFDSSRKLSEEHLAALLEAVRLSPSSFGLQPWKFYVVVSQDVKDQLVASSWNQAQVRDCSHLIVMTARKRIDSAYVESFVADTAATRGTPREKLKGMHDMILGFVEADPEKFDWCARQTYIALGTLMQTAALLGIDACPMEGIDKADYDRILNVDPAYATTVACPVGYRAAGDRYAGLAKVRFPKDRLFVTV